MFRSRQNSKAIRYAISGVLAAGLLAGCAGSAKMARTGGAAETALSPAKSGRAVARAEEAVQRTPNDIAGRVALGQAYLDAGRFQSAATTLQDAVTLGDASGGTQLRLALAHIGAGDNQAAIAVLDQAADTIAVRDRGLALALAGQSSRGVELLSEALRTDENSPALRQNLAYAYALDGRWREARVMASQDLPADQIDARISDWAMAGKPEDFRRRIAALLRVPATANDPGQPAQLALNGSASDEQVAAAPVPIAPSVRTAAAELPATTELPAIEQPAIQQPASVPFAAAVPASAAYFSPAPEAPAAPASTDFAAAFAQTASVSQPVIQKTPVPREVSRAPLAAAPYKRPAVLRTGSHSVQLGSFSSARNAQRAVQIFTARNPELRGYHLTVTPAVVRGKNFWRVAAAGFTANTAGRLCSGVRNRGGACFAYATNSLSSGPKPALAYGYGAARARR